MMLSSTALAHMAGHPLQFAVAALDCLARSMPRALPLLLPAAWDGKWVFVAALGLVLVWLIVMPRRLVTNAAQPPPLWRNVRFWAIVVCVIQIWIYWQFG